MPWILSAAFLVVEALAVASAVHALFTVRTAQGTIAWVIGLITFPWLGLPLYWMFKSAISANAEMYRARSSGINRRSTKCAPK